MINDRFKTSLIEYGWYPYLESYFNSPNWDRLRTFLADEYKKHTCFPKLIDIFQVLKQPLSEVKVVVVGQDPYHGPGQANGLAFAVNKGQIYPPSLRNIFSELKQDTGGQPDDGSLLGWQAQGVMLLNASLTVRHGQPGSHSDIGWQELTDLIIKTVSDQSPRCVFILWGNHARKKRHLINYMKHGIVESAHPSPLSCRGFYGTKPFSKTNEILTRYGVKPINWSK